MASPVTGTSVVSHREFLRPVPQRGKIHSWRSRDSAGLEKRTRYDVPKSGRHLLPRAIDTTNAPAAESNQPNIPKAYLNNPVLRSVVCGNKRIEDLELEVFGADKIEMKRLTSKMKSSKFWREQVDIILALRRHNIDADSIFLSAAFSSLPKNLRRNSLKLSSGDSAELDQAVDWLLEKVLPAIPAMDAQGLVNVAVGLAKLELDAKPILEKVVCHSVHKMKSGMLTAHGLSNLVWALAASDVRPSGAWLSEFWIELDAQLDHLSGQDVGNLFWSICRLELMPPWVTGSMPAMIPHAIESVGSAETGQDSAIVLVCFAIWHRNYSFNPPAQYINQLLDAMQPRLKSYLPQDLVSTVHSLVVMNHFPSRPWMNDFYLVLRERLTSNPTLSYSDFQRLLWALSRIDYVPSKAWLGSFVEVSRGKLCHLRFRALSELLWALACWGYTPTPEWLHEYFRVTLAKLGDFKTGHLSNSLMALKKLGCKVPTTWLDAALLSYCKQMHDSQAHDLVTFIDSIVDVCEDAAWMSQPATGQRLRMLADFAASKFDIFDCVMQAKLVIALATAKCCPSAAWFNKHQACLANSLRTDADELDSATAADIQNAYASLDVQLNPGLAKELKLRSS